ncbi:MAG: hypothetical protein H0W34_00430 [Pyrinomonadaceae bacterium]|nr:hypothetical protein [Pyrinomonadaceae bacterium]
MEVFLLIVIGTVVAVFVVTAAFTLLAIVKIRGKRPCIEFVNVKFRDRLFHVLILEVVAICLSTVAYALKGMSHLQTEVGADPATACSK